MMSCVARGCNLSRMGFDPIVLAVPGYFVLMGLEGALNARKKLGLYALGDTLANLACGVYQQLLVTLLVLPLNAPYRLVYERLRATDWFAAHPGWAWAFAFVGADFFYYWFHRWSHENAVGWFSHVVHHQSERYNLSVALRQDAWQPLFSLWFFLPLALVGVPPAIFLSAYGVVIVYQFWIHTRLIDRLGVFEQVFNTPSHHRVHHGVDPQYLDKNYAGVFIVWDRWFGTFEPEGVAPTYGTIEALTSFNPAWAHWEYGAKLVDKMRAARSPLEALSVLWRGPGWMPGGAPSLNTQDDFRARQAQALYNVESPRRARIEALAVFALAMVATLAVLARKDHGADLRNLTLSLVAGWNLANASGLVEAKAWARASTRAGLGAMLLTLLVWAVGLGR